MKNQKSVYFKLNYLYFSRDYRECQKSFKDFLQRIDEISCKYSQENSLIGADNLTFISARIDFLNLIIEETSRFKIFLGEKKELTPKIFNLFKKGNKAFFQSTNPLKVLEAHLKSFYAEINILERKKEFINLFKKTSKEFRPETFLENLDLLKAKIEEDLHYLEMEQIFFFNSGKIFVENAGLCYGNNQDYSYFFQNNLVFINDAIFLVIKKIEYSETRRNLLTLLSYECPLGNLKTLENNAKNLLEFIENIRTNILENPYGLGSFNSQYYNNLYSYMRKNLALDIAAFSVYILYFSIDVYLIKSQKKLQFCSSLEEKLNYLTGFREEMQKVILSLEQPSPIYNQSIKKISLIDQANFQDLKNKIIDTCLKNINLFSEEISYLTFEKNFKKYTKKIKNIAKEFNKICSFNEKNIYLKSSIEHIEYFIEFLQKTNRFTPDYIAQHFLELKYIRDANLGKLVENLTNYRDKCAEKVSEAEIPLASVSNLSVYIEPQINKAARPA